MITMMRFRGLVILIVGNLITSDDCNCSHCEDRVKVIGIEENEDNQSGENQLLKEDPDGDGSRTICARDRDHEDQTFPSVCHMMCYNRCTEYHVRKHDIHGHKINRMSAFRTNYYKLHDGPCPKRLKEVSSKKQ